MINGIAMKGRRKIIPLFITETNTGTVAKQPYGQQKDRTFSEGVGVFGRI